MENLYSYCISATDKNNNTVYLDVYSGPSGPAVGGHRNCVEAARQLADYILQTNPADYRYEGEYENEIIVKMGVKDGCPYYEEEEKRSV